MTATPGGGTAPSAHDELDDLLGDLDPPDLVEVSDDQIDVPDITADGWAHGIGLSAIRASWRGQLTTPVPRAVDPASVHFSRDGQALRIGSHLSLDPLWGSVGTGTGPDRITGPVRASYRYWLSRLDGIVSLPTGGLELRRGEPHLTTPMPPRLEQGEELVATVYTPRGGFGHHIEVFPVELTAPVPSRSTPGRLPRSLQRLRDGEGLRVVSWGDSVTAGGDSTTEETAFPLLFAKRLRRAYPNATVEQRTVAVGGTHSQQWFDAVSDACSWQRVADARPDLLTVEFVNDAPQAPEAWDELYEQIRRRTAELGAELLLITPHFVKPSMMGITDLREPDPRAYTRFLHRFAQLHGIALADASYRWEQLWRLGLPYPTLLWNGINHPDDRGHNIFAQEMGACLGIPQD